MKREEAFLSAREDARSAERCVPCKQTLSPSYRLAYRDEDFLLRDELRPIRLQLELLKPELILQEHKIENTVIVFGSARIPEPAVARKKLKDAKAAFAQEPSNKELGRKVKLRAGLSKVRNTTKRQEVLHALFLNLQKPLRTAILS